MTPPGADSRRVVVKMRVARVGAEWGQNAAKLHLSYLTREGVDREGGEGVLYDRDGRVEASEFEKELPEEQHQFRLVISPEDGEKLDLRDYVERYMRRIEKDLGTKLVWCAVNHHDTAHPHAHVIVRGVDAKGQEVRMDREYVSNGLRGRAQELATKLLGPRPERQRRKALKKDIDRVAYTALDAALKRRALNAQSGKVRDPHYAAALKGRLQFLKWMGLAEEVSVGWGKKALRLDPNLRTELMRLSHREAALGTIAKVTNARSDRCRVIDRDEPGDSEREELTEGRVGVLRWKGLDEKGRFAAVVETSGGQVYHLPVSGRVAQDAKTGQGVELKRAVDKDQRIESVASEKEWQYDVKELPPRLAEVHERRLEQLERMGLATRQSEGGWKLDPNFRARAAAEIVQPFWQKLSLRSQAQPLAAQVNYAGAVWLDRVPREGLAGSGFGLELKNLLSARREWLVANGLDPAAEDFTKKLTRLQQERLESSLAKVWNAQPLGLRDGFEGRATVIREDNGRQFVAVRDGRKFVVMSYRDASSVTEGARVRLDFARGKAPKLTPATPEQDRSPG